MNPCNTTSKIKPQGNEQVAVGCTGMPGFELKNGTSRHLTSVRSPPRNSTRGPRETCPPDQLRARSRCPAPPKRARAARGRRCAVPRQLRQADGAAAERDRAAAPHTWHSCTGAHLAAHLCLRCGAGRHTPCLQTAGGKLKGLSSPLHSPSLSPLFPYRTA